VIVETLIEEKVLKHVGDPDDDEIADEPTDDGEHES
jgi:hypothetical protein